MQTKLCFIVPAAGIGSRFCEILPKQYHKVDDLTVIEHTLNVLSHFDAQIVVAIHEQDTLFGELEVPKAIKVKTVIGGETRAQSVMNALESLKDTPPDWVLVHDAARPLVSVEDIELLIDECVQYPPGGLLVAPSIDTLKYTDGTKVQETLDREQVYRALTPQMFQYQPLYKAYKSAIEQGLNITDEASTIEAAGFKPHLVVGESANFKITHPRDLVLAKAILQEEAAL